MTATLTVIYLCKTYSFFFFLKVECKNINEHSQLHVALGKTHTVAFKCCMQFFAYNCTALIFGDAQVAAKLRLGAKTNTQKIAPLYANCAFVLFANRKLLVGVT